MYGWLHEAGIYPTDIGLLQRAASGAGMAIITVTGWEEAQMLWQVCNRWWMEASFRARPPRGGIGLASMALCVAACPEQHTGRIQGQQSS